MAKENDEVNRAEIEAFFAHQRTYHLFFCGLTLAVAAFITTVCAWFGASPWLAPIVLLVSAVLGLAFWLYLAAGELDE